MPIFYMYYTVIHEGNPGVGGMNQHTSDGSAFTRVTTAPSIAPATVAISAGMNQTTSGATAANVSTVSGVVSNECNALFL